MGSVEVFRLHLVRRTGGKVRLFEDREEFERVLLEAALSSLVHESRRYDTTVRLSREWLSKVLKRGEDAPEIERVHKAQQLVDGEWQDLDWRLFPPRLEYSVEVADDEA